MRVQVAVESRYLRDRLGRVWTVGGADYSFWLRYLQVFDGVDIIARAAPVDAVPTGATRVDGVGVRLRPLPHFVGMMGRLRVQRNYQRALQEALEADAALVLRLPGHVGAAVARHIDVGRPYAVEVVGDPAEVFAPGSSSHPLRPVLRAIFTRSLRRAVSGASCVSYVSKAVLPQQYPASPAAFSTNYSSIVLPLEFFAEPRKHPRGSRTFKFVTVGSMEQPYKGIDVAIAALAIAVGHGVDMALDVVGDGRLREQLEARSRTLQVSDRVRFLGKVEAGMGVRDVLMASDAFVLASRTEGLPRAMIEAMAVGLPAVGSNVGGIPELLDQDDLFEREDAQVLSGLMIDMARDGHRYEEKSRRAVGVAKEYREDVLADRRKAMYLTLRRVSEEWLARSHQ